MWIQIGLLKNNYIEMCLEYTNTHLLISSRRAASGYLSVSE